MQAAARVADMPDIFAAAEKGDLELLKIAMDAANKEVDPTEEEAKGGSGEVGKMLLSSGNERLALRCYVPTTGKAAGKCDASEWMKAVLASIGEGTTFIEGDAVNAVGEIMMLKSLYAP